MTAKRCTYHRKADFARRDAIAAQQSGDDDTVDVLRAVAIRADRMASVIHRLAGVDSRSCVQIPALSKAARRQAREQWMATL